LRARWEWFHALRSWISVAGLALLIAGALFWRDNVTEERSSIEADAPRDKASV
jgi:hypothetical protein